MEHMASQYTIILKCFSNSCLKFYLEYYDIVCTVLTVTC